MAAMPPQFDEAFLQWFQDRTEAAWSTYHAPSSEEFVLRWEFGCEWQPGTHWLGGLSEEQIAAAQTRWRLPFPPDYHLFLKRLHSVDRSMKCREGRKEVSDTPTLHDGPSFYNWLSDDRAIQGRLEALVGGLQFDVEVNDLWRPSWGLKPATAVSRAQHVRDLVSAAPRLIPVFRHRYLLVDPPQGGASGTPCAHTLTSACFSPCLGGS
jgi:hypothetical protein